MITIRGEYTNYFEVEIPVDKYEDIFFENMKKEDSDELIRGAIRKKYGDCADEIFVFDEVEKG